MSTTGADLSNKPRAQQTVSLRTPGRAVLKATALVVMLGLELAWLILLGYGLAFLFL
jgi:hypothetical protein